MAVIEQLGNLEYKITLNTDGLERGQKKASSIMSRLDTNLGRLANLTLASQGITAFSKRILSMGTDVVKAATTMESLERGLRAVAGGAAQADAQLIGLREVAKLPGLGLQEAVQGAVNLQAAGLSAQRATDSLKAFGNALATVGKGKAELDGVILALTQMQAKGKLSAEEINQIAERVPQIRRVMVEAFGTAIPKEIEKMGISVDDFIDRVNTQLMGLPQVVGGAANTFENLGDSIFEVKSRIGELFLPAVITAADAFASAIGGINTALTPLSEQVASDIAQWDSLKTQWQAQDTEITKLVGQYQTLQTRLKELTESGGDTHVVNLDLERVNKRLIKLVPQLGVAYDEENKTLQGLNETLERHREAKARMLRQKFRENLEDITKATKEATEAEKTATRQHDLQVLMTKKLIEGNYQLGKALDRNGLNWQLHSKTQKEATSVSALFREAEKELGISQNDRLRVQTDLIASLKDGLDIEQALSLQVGASKDAMSGYRAEIETLQGTVRSYVETTGKENIAQFNELVGMYSALANEQGEVTKATPEYTAALNKLATQVNLTGTALEQGLGAKIPVVTKTLEEATKPDYNFKVKAKIPTAEEINKEIKDFETKVNNALSMVEAQAKTKGTFDLEQTVRDQLALIDSIIQAEDISEQDLFTKYQGLYTKRADLREALKVEIEKKAKAEAATELKAAKDKMREQDAAERIYAREHSNLVDARTAKEVQAAKDQASAIETSANEREAFEGALAEIMLQFGEEKTRAEADALDEQYKAFKERNRLYIENNEDAQAEIDYTDSLANTIKIQRARDADEEIAVGAKEWQDRETADKKAAVELREWLEMTAEERIQAQKDADAKKRAADRAATLKEWLKVWGEVGSAVVDLGYVIDQDLGENLETALNLGGMFLQTMQAVQLAMAGTGSWWTVAAQAISLTAGVLHASGVFGESAAQKRSKAVKAEIKELSDDITALEKQAHLGAGFWDFLEVDQARINRAKQAIRDAENNMLQTFPTLWEWQQAEREITKAKLRLLQIQDEEEAKSRDAHARKKAILQQRVAEIQKLSGDLLGGITDTIADAMSDYSSGWDKVEDAIERNLMGAIFQGVLDAQLRRWELEPLIEQYVAFLTEALDDGTIDSAENIGIEERADKIKSAGMRIRHNTKEMLNSAWGFNFREFFPEDEDLPDVPTLEPLEMPEMSTGLTTSIRNITRSQADALSAVFSNISAINGRIADNTLRTADLLESYLPTLSGGGMMVQSTDVGGASYVSPDYAQAMSLQTANRAS